MKTMIIYIIWYLDDLFWSTLTSGSWQEFFLYNNNSEGGSGVPLPKSIFSFCVRVCIFPYNFGETE